MNDFFAINKCHKPKNFSDSWKRIEICGGIASGKTTLAALLKRINIEPILENFESNPFWRSFYANPQKYAFETEITFLLQHYHQIKTNFTKDKIVCDFSLILDLAYAKVTLTQSQQQAFFSVYNEIRREIPLPSLLIYLQCSSGTELQRIRNRGRTTETSINLDFLEKLNKSLAQCIRELSNDLPVVKIDSEKLDFAHDESVKQSLVNTIKEYI